MWERIPSRLRYHRSILFTCIRNLLKREQGELAEEILRDALKSTRNDYLIYLYGIVSGSDPARQLDYAERLLKQDGDSAMLLLTLGRLSGRNALWGKARSSR